MNHVGKRFPAEQSHVTVKLRNSDVHSLGTGANVLAALRKEAEAKAAKKGKTLTGDYAARVDKKKAAHIVQFALSE